ncbi:MAG TPA: hypothetical protein VFT49_00455 [Candidatus Saccharimonadales bacterium]|nr:hypothetical protein [Candidatus Saccharimonadales bacterium]
MVRHHNPQPQTAMGFVLKALIPYSRQNMLLVFDSNTFFQELEKISRYKKRTLQNALYEAERRKLIEKQANAWRLTIEGQKNVRPFVAERLSDGAKLMVIFDIPEDMAVTRAKFRRTLKLWQFAQVQKSVWTTSLDHKQSIKDLVNEMDLEPYVQLYECSSL